VEEYLVQLQDRIAPSFECDLPTGRGSSCFMHMEVAVPTLRKERRHKPWFPRDWFLIQLHLVFQCE
jgi:hypothetical protein